jgi:hypothetical protein
MSNRFFGYILGVGRGSDLFGLAEPSSADDLNWDLSSWFISLVLSKDENGRKRSKTDLRYRKTKTVGSGYFYI